MSTEKPINQCECHLLVPNETTFEKITDDLANLDIPDDVKCSIQARAFHDVPNGIRVYIAYPDHPVLDSHIWKLAEQHPIDYVFDTSESD